jgi:hypothetical protein
MLDPRMNIVKDPGGMMVGGEKELTNQLRDMQVNERPGATFESIRTDTAPKDPHAVALNGWIDTKVKKYLRNQLGSKDDPILKAIDEGVQYNHGEVAHDAKNYAERERMKAGKPLEGIAKTEAGKAWENKVDSQFNIVKSQDIKDILNKNMPDYTEGYKNAADKYKMSMLRMEHDLPINNSQDLEAISLIHHIPDEKVHSVYMDLPNKLGLNHVSDVLYEDLQNGRLRPEQLNQMSIEKAIKRTSEYDAEKAKIAEKADVDRIQGMPVHKEYGDSYKWIELKHPSNDNITKEALQSEGNQMGHCVGSSDRYFNNVINGDTKIISLRDANNKPHVTLELNKKPIVFSDVANVMGEQRAAALLEEIHGSNGTTKDFANVARQMFPELDTYDIAQVKGKENKKPLDKYQSYISDFINKPTVSGGYGDIGELYNTDLISAKDVKSKGVYAYDHGNKFADLIINDPHFKDAAKLAYPEHDKAWKNANSVPEINAWAKQDANNKKDMILNIVQELQNKNMHYFTVNDLIDHIKENHLPKPPTQQFADGGKVTERDPRHGGLKATNYPNPYGLRSWQDESGEYHGQMMPKTSGWQGEIPTLTGDVMTELSLGGNTPDEPFYPMITQNMTPDMISRVKDFEAGLIEADHPDARALLKHARKEAQRLMDQGKSPFKDYN